MLRTLRAILERPTAPFREAAVLDAIDAFAAERAPRVSLRRDRAGNRILAVRGAKAARRAPTIAFTAHLDHPGLVPDAKGTWELLGRVAPPQRLRGGRIRFFRADGTDAGRGSIARVDVRKGRVLVTFAKAPPPGASFAMFDFPALRIRGDRITGRVCDDLLGAISILLAIDECLANAPTCSFLAAFTRAEEVGFVGAMAMLRGTSIPRSIPIVGLECSAARGGNAVVGAGPIVRTGDRISTFDPGVTAFLRDCAQELAREDPRFHYQRRLMQGGACESTAYLLDGRRAGGLCLALGNYHNVPDVGPDDPSTGLRPEYVSRRDLEGLARLIARAVVRSDAIADPWKPTRAGLANTLRALAPRLHERV